MYRQPGVICSWVAMCYRCGQPMFRTRVVRIGSRRSPKWIHTSCASGADDE